MRRIYPKSCRIPAAYGLNPPNDRSRGKPMLGCFDVRQALPVAEMVGAVREPEDESDIDFRDLRQLRADC